MDEERARRIARNEVLFREANEAARAVAERFGGDAPLQDFLCECGDRACTEKVSVTLAEYLDVRADPRRFVILPGHEIPEVEVVVEQSERYAVVEKIGEGGRVAEEQA